MSRRDAGIDTRASVLASRMICDLTSALKYEIGAHNATRIERNTNTERVKALLGNVRGLELKVSTLQTELDEMKSHYVPATASVYHEGYLAGLVAAKAAIEALEK